MKIVFVYDAIYPWVKGGVEKRIWELALRLSRRGHEIHIFGMKFWDGDDIMVKDGVVLHGISPSRRFYVGGRRSIMGALLFGMHLLLPLARERGWDLIECQQFPFISCFPARLVSQLRHKPLVITWHEVWGQYWYEYLGLPGVAGKVTESVVARFRCPVIAVSPATASRFLAAFNKPVDIIVPNGIDLAEIAATQPSPESSDIIFVGRLIPEKHVDLILDAFSLVVAGRPGLHLVIIGDGPEWEALQALVHRRSLDRSVTMTGFLESHAKIIARMKSSKVFVIPSTREGFGMTAIEALACGLPVVTVDQPGNAVRDLIAEETGFLCTLSAEDLAEKIGIALSRGDAMRAACIRSVEASDWERIVDSLEDYYRSVTNTS